MEFFNQATTAKINSAMETLQKRLGIFNFTDQTSGFIRNFTTVEFLLT